MGYSTEFHGQIEINPPLNQKEIEYLNKFSETRRMLREKGPYFVDGTGDFGQGQDKDILEYNRPPEGQPGLWCQWVATSDGKYIEWNGAEKFYYAAEWMEYIIDHFIGDNPIARKELTFLQGHKCNGRILAQGEDITDRWELIVEQNKVYTFFYLNQV